MGETFPQMCTLKLSQFYRFGSNFIDQSWTRSILWGAGQIRQRFFGVAKGKVWCHSPLLTVPKIA